MANAIIANSLTKRYKNTPAVSNVSFDVREGEIFGLIGPDGAGKTSIFRMLTTLIQPDSGSGEICGLDICKDIFKIRRIIGYMPGRFSLYQDLSVEENLNFFATMFGTTVAQNYESVREIYSQIEPFRSRKAGKLSGGMKQKLALCCALIHKPKVLFLDEPTTGVDAVSRKEFWTMLARIRKSGVTIFVSTPYMDEANLCDRIAMIRKGEIIESGTPANITNAYPYPLLAIKGSNLLTLLKHLRRIDGVISCYSFGNAHHLTFDPRITSQEQILADVKKEGFIDCCGSLIKPGIEDCFLLKTMNTESDTRTEKTFNRKEYGD